MDRSFLSDSNVIQASRSFVCIRLATYESAYEAKVLEWLYTGRSGEVENTTFAMLSPDGKRQLVRPGRGPQSAFRDAADMASFMRSTARTYPGKPDAQHELPTLPTVRLALNVAACEKLPLVVVHGRDAAEARALAARVAPLAWRELAGRAVYTRTHRAADLSALKGDTKPGVLVVRPSSYGVAGTVLVRLGSKSSDKALGVALDKALTSNPAAPGAASHFDHVRQGRQRGVFWKTAIPVTDPQANRAR